MTIAPSRIAAIAALVAIAVVLVVAMASRGTDDPLEQVVAAPASAAENAESPTPTPVPEPIPVLRPAPTLEDVQGWINSEPTSFEAIQTANKVTVVQFWTFGCFNCKNTLPALRDLYAEYHDQGLEIVGVHAPEFSYEGDPDNVADAVVDLDVIWPVALDPDKQNFREWQKGGRRFWPRIYIIDQDGNIRFDHVGEGKYSQIEDTVARLLAET
jgi:thiol-disulfide isomerase/thioredoxin